LLRPESDVRLKVGIVLSQEASMSHLQSQWCPECTICRKPVTLEESKVDENGQATHEECYVSKMTGKTAEPYMKV
jgi:hypothetical protein